MIERPTLPSLLAGVLKTLKQAYGEQGALTRQMPSLDTWANLLRGVTEEGSELRELPLIACLSRRAVRSRVATAVRRGWLEKVRFRRDHPIVRLTALGAEVSARWKSLQETAEKKWQAEVGAGRADRLRTCLEELVAGLPLEHPHYPASYGAADARITGGNGRDWKAVPRGRGNDVSNLSLSALVSQALVAFAIDYEKKSPVALSLSSAVIRRIPAEGRALQELGDSVGVSALARHGFLRVSGTRGTQIVFLTSSGLAVSEAYERRIQGVEREWRHRFGDENVRALRHVLEELTQADS